MRLNITTAKLRKDPVAGLEELEKEFSNSSERADAYLALNDTLSQLQGDMANESTQVSVEEYRSKTVSTESGLVVAGLVAAAALLFAGIYKIYKHFSDKSDTSSASVSGVVDQLPEEMEAEGNLKAVAGTPVYTKLLNANIALYLTKRRYITDSNGLLSNFRSPTDYIKTMGSIGAVMEVALQSNQSLDAVLKQNDMPSDAWAKSYENVINIAKGCGWAQPNDFMESFKLKSDTKWGAFFNTEYDYIKGLDKALVELYKYLQSSNEKPVVNEHELAAFMCNKDSFRVSALTFKQAIETLQSDSEAIASAAEKAEKEMNGLKAKIQQKSQETEVNEYVAFYIGNIKQQANIYKNVTLISIACNKYCLALAEGLMSTSTIKD